MPAVSIGARGFLSYTRKDNEEFENVATKLKTQLEGRFAAATGRELEIFLDRESIGWGEDWRTKIRESVKSAVFFIPVITMRYFTSEACREELLAFWENARQLGVTELILPIVLTGSEEIRSDDPREEVRLIESLNYRDIEDAWLSGYGSSEWLRAVHGMVNGLKRGLIAAEDALEQQEISPVATSVVSNANSSIETSNPADVTALNQDLAGVLEQIEATNSAMSAFSAATTESMGGLDLGSLPPAQQQMALLRIAKALRQPAEHLGSSGMELERRIGAMDARLRAVVEELRSIDADLAQQQLDQLLLGFSGAQDLAPVVLQLDQFIQVLRFAALISVSLRKSLEPAIQGVQSIEGAAATFESWRSI